jgi:hypothetical protein
VCVCVFGNVVEMIWKRASFCDECVSCLFVERRPRALARVDDGAIGAVQTLNRMIVRVRMGCL